MTPKYTPTPSFVSVRDAAEQIGLAVRTVQFLIKDGKIAASKIGPATSAYVIEQAEVDRVVAERVEDTKRRADGVSTS